MTSKYRIGILLVSGFLLAKFGSTSSAQTITLNQAILRALDNDPVIQKIYADVMQADGYTTEVRSAMRPRLTLNGDTGYGYRSRSIGGLARGGRDLFDRRAGLIVEQLIWDNGYSKHRWRDAKFRRKAASLLDKAQRETTAMGTIEAYLHVLQARKQAALAQQNLSSHGKFYRMARDRAAGVGNKADEELAFARLQLAQSLKEERNLDLKQAESEFIRYVGVKPPSLVHPKVPRIETVTSIDPTENYHYQATLHQCRAAQLASAAIRRSKSPTVLARGSGSYGVDVLGIEGEDKSSNALMVMEWNVIEGGRKRGQMRQAEGDIARQVAIVNETKILLERDIRSRWADYSRLGRRIEILQNYTKGLADTVELYRKQFELNKRPLLGILDIENEKISSEMRLVEEQFERSLNAYRLLFYSGGLVRATVGQSHLDREITCVNLSCPGTDDITCEPELPAKIIEQEYAEKEQYLRDFVRLAIVDGQFDESERQRIFEIGSRMGIPADQVHAIYEQYVQYAPPPVAIPAPVETKKRGFGWFRKAKTESSAASSSLPDPAASLFPSVPSVVTAPADSDSFNPYQSAEETPSPTVAEINSGNQAAGSNDSSPFVSATPVSANSDSAPSVPDPNAMKEEVVHTATVSVPEKKKRGLSFLQRQNSSPKPPATAQAAAVVISNEEGASESGEEEMGFVETNFTETALLEGGEDTTAAIVESAPGQNLVTETLEDSSAGLVPATPVVVPSAGRPERKSKRGLKWFQRSAPPVPGTSPPEVETEDLPPAEPEAFSSPIPESFEEEDPTVSATPVPVPVPASVQAIPAASTAMAIPAMPSQAQTKKKGFRLFR